MKKILIALFFVAFTCINVNAQNSVKMNVQSLCSLVVTSTTVCTPDNCGGNPGGGSGVITSGTAPYTSDRSGPFGGVSFNGSNILLGPNFAPTGQSGNYTITVTDSRGCSATAAILWCTPVQPQLYQMIWTKTDANCITTTGTINPSVTAQGNPMNTSMRPKYYVVRGTGNTTFPRVEIPIGTPLTGLVSGTYDVMAEIQLGDWQRSWSPYCCGNGFTSITIANTCQPLVLTSSIVTPAICTAKGTAKVVATGGVGNYTYSWNTTPVQTTATATNLLGGSYTCTVTSGNNTQTSTVNLPQTNTVFNVTIKPKASGSGPRRANLNNTIEVNINNSLPAANTYTYLWSTGATSPSIDLGYKAANNNNTRIAVAKDGTPIPPPPPVVTTPAPTTTYTVTVTDRNGCIGTASYVY